MNYTLEISEDFERDLLDAEDFIFTAYGSKSDAENLFKKTNEVLNTISENPFRFPLYYLNEKLFSKGFRAATVNSYIIFFVVDKNKHVVRVHRLINRKRNIENVL